ncbi:hypothetical protein [Faunimonas pinastri]|uniref:hypothetical protein n=1 Tax=Faunimonas pinastri TaxID=1855383 RepID=UPI00115F8819|nr:hypothetical protein [Faunimonas pinastri]
MTVPEADHSQGIGDRGFAARESAESYREGYAAEDRPGQDAPGEQESSGAAAETAALRRAVARTEPLPAPLPPLRSEVWPDWKPQNPPAVPQVQQQRIPDLPSLPRIQERRTGAIALSFAVFVLLPILLTALYSFFIASKEYVSEFRFSVTDTSASSGSGSLQTLATVIGGGGSSAGGSQQNYIVTDFLTSRQAVDELEKRIHIRELYSGDVGDRFSRFDDSRSMEDFVAYWKRMISASFDPVTGIANARVKAFRPQDAQLIARTLVTLSEELINDLALRSQKDAVRFAEQEVQRAQDRMQTAKAAMDAYRNTEGVIDPNSNLVSSNIDLAKTLRANLSALQTQLATLTRQHLDASSPAVQTVQTRINATRDQLASIERQVGNNRGGSESLTRVVSQYEKLDMDRQYAQTMLVSTMQALDQARANAAAQHLYLTPYVQPALPESASYPRPFLATMRTAMIAACLWFIGLVLVRAIRDHAR